MKKQSQSKIEEIKNLEKNIKKIESKVRDLKYQYGINDIFDEIENAKDNLNMIAIKYSSMEDELNLLQKKVLKEKDNENADLNRKITGKEEKIKQLEKDNNQLNNQLKNKEKKLENINNQLKEKDSEYQKALTSIKDKDNEITNILGKIKQLEKDNDQLKNQLKNQSEKYNGAITGFEKMSKDYDILKNEREQLKIAKKENEDLAKKNEELIKSNFTRKEFINEDQAKNFYDVVLELDSINKLFKSGWKISYNEKRKGIYEKIITDKTLKIGVLGLNNVGKSFILGLLTGVVIPTGYSVETKGISIKYTEGEKDSDSGICLIDSAGFETPLLEEEVKDLGGDNTDVGDEMEQNYKYMEELNEIAKDKGQIERFIEELIISLSDMLIVVVGKLTRREQNLISRIKGLFHDKENIQFKSIIIIHNLAQYNEINEVEKHINNVLKKSATFKIEENKIIGKKEYQGRIFYSEKDGTDHFIMARQGSPAGNEYNEMTIKLIKDKYNECKHRKILDIPKEIVNLFSKLSKDIIEEDISPNNLEIKDNTIIINSKEETKKEIQKCQQPYIDSMGHYNSISAKFIPKYSYYAYKENIQNILLFRLEIPGKLDKLTAFFQYYGKKKVIVIKGEKSKDEFPEMGKKGFLTIKDNRNYEQISYYLELEQDIELYKEKPIEDTGIYEFNFNKKNREKNEEDDDDEDEEDNKEKKEKESKNKENANDNNKNIVKIASGVYILKFLITDTSMKKLRKKYKEKNKN